MPQATVNNPCIDFTPSALTWGEEISFPNTRTFRQGSHRIFNRYPARSICLVPRAIIRELCQEHARGVSVLDPFMGSGTTAVEATMQGCTIYGVEIDPLARLITEVRLYRYNHELISELTECFHGIESKWLVTKQDESLAPQLQRIESWFTPAQYKELLRLKTAIYSATAEDSPSRNFFRIVLADMVRPCSQAERQTLKPYISTKYIKQATPVAVAFAKSFAAHIAAVAECNEGTLVPSRSRVQWLGTDAAKFRKSTKPITVAITSPPYANALDYVRCIKIESAWVDCGSDPVFAELRRGQIGDPARARAAQDDVVEAAVGHLCRQIEIDDAPRARTVRGYFADMLNNLQCVHRTLVAGGRYHVIVGDGVIRKVSVPTHKIIASLGESVGFKWVHYYKYRIRDHRTSIPRQNQGGKIEYEHVVVLEK